MREFPRTTLDRRAAVSFMKYRSVVVHDVPLRPAVDGISEVAICRLGRDGTILSWNDGAKRITGYAPHEIVGRDIGVLLSPADLAAGVAAQILRTARQTGRYAGEGWRVRRDGEHFWAHVVVEALHDRRGSVIGFTELTRDETERAAKDRQRHALVNAALDNVKRMVALVDDLTQRDLSESRSTAELRDENRWMNIAQALAKYGHWRHDVRTGKSVSSAELLRIFGLPLGSQPSNETILAAFDPCGVDVREIAARATIDGEPLRYESRILRPEGTWVNVEFSAVGERDAAGTLTGIVGLVKDRTQ